MRQSDEKPYQLFCEPLHLVTYFDYKSATEIYVKCREAFKNIYGRDAQMPNFFTETPQLPTKNAPKSFSIRLPF